MITVCRTTAFLLFVIFLTLATADTNQRTQPSSLSPPKNITVVGSVDDDDDDDDDDGDEELFCWWKWSRWSDCTKECGSGNTTRQNLCYCSGMTVPVSADYCEGTTSTTPLMIDNVPCNEQECNQMSACNKVCWMNIISERLTINMINGVFNCSMGCPNDNSCPKGKSYTQILDQPVPQAENSEWYYLAKEWYTAILNKENGVQFSTLALQAIDEAQLLLENCTGWSPENMNLLAQVYATKEKLNRANNGIGGLSEVDQQVASLIEGGYGMTGEPSEGSSIDPTVLVLCIVIPSVVVILVLVVVFSFIYYRRRSDVVVAHAEFPSDDDDRDNVPLQTPVVQSDGVESESEEKLE